MKNTIPIIIAVVLAAAAVFALSRIIKPKESEKERHPVPVVFTSKDIPPDTVIQEAWLVKREMEADSLPKKFIPWSRANLVVGQKSNRTIPAGDYVLLSDIE